ncbi:MAG TPA: Ig-like domain-containing protein, partial [Gemmatimonadales bacterium]
ADPQGDVGPNHYLQIVNSSIAVFSKTGTLLLGPLPTHTVFAGLGGACGGGSGYDGIVLYDPLADRWLISQLAWLDQFSGPYWECVAVSRTPDPMGQYAQYAYSYTNFNDYPKLGVWPDGYYVTYNMFVNASVTARLLARRICAFDRARMLAGEPASPQQCVDITFGEVSGLTPADFDGDLPPPPGEPAPSVGFFQGDSLVVYRFHVNWSAVENSSIDAVLISVAAFQPLCGASRTPYCVLQLGGPVLDGLGDRMMFRVAYRNMGGYQSLIANHNVTTGTSAGVRWYEIRDPAGDPFVYQQGTYAPDSNSRWVGSAAMDRGGNIGLGFSISGAQQNVAMGITGRTPTDPPGVMGQGETVIPGGGAENSVRWGDYSSLSVDPSDDCTFWYTSQYIPFDGARNWRTRVATFQLPGCATAPDFAVWMSADPGSVVRGGTTTFTVSTASLRSSAAARAIQLAVPQQLGPGVSATVTPSQVSPGQAATVTVTADASAPIGEVPFAVQATGAGVTLSATASVMVIDSDFAISVDKPSTTLGAAGNTDVTVRVSPVFGNPEVVVFSATGLPRSVRASFDPIYTRVGGATTLHLTGSQFLYPGATNIKVTAAGSLVVRSAVIHLRTLLQPVVHILDPLPYSNVSGTVRVSVTAGASLGTTLSRIELYLDDDKIQGLQALSSPAQLTWNTNSVNDGPHYLRARATDAEGNQGSSAGVAIWVQNGGLCGCSSDAGGWEALALFGLLAAIRRRKR